MEGRILVIDDTKNIRLLTQKALSTENYEVDVAADGNEGIEKFLKNAYDLVLLDIRMPSMSGTEVLKRIKNINEKIPVIIITAFPTVKNAVDCIKLGAIDYLRKPFTAEKIISIVGKILERKDLKDIDDGNYDDLIEYSKKCINELNLDEALKTLKRAISINIEEAEPFNIIGNVYEIKQDYTKAHTYYNIALQLNPNNEIIIENINRIKLHQ